MPRLRLGTTTRDKRGRGPGPAGCTNVMWGRSQPPGCPGRRSASLRPSSSWRQRSRRPGQARPDRRACHGLAGGAGALRIHTTAGLGRRSCGWGRPHGAAGRTIGGHEVAMVFEEAVRPLPRRQQAPAFARRRSRVRVPRPPLRGRFRRSSNRRCRARTAALDRAVGVGRTRAAPRPVNSQALTATCRKPTVAGASLAARPAPAPDERQSSGTPPTLHLLSGGASVFARDVRQLPNQTARATAAMSLQRHCSRRPSGLVRKLAHVAGEYARSAREQVQGRRRPGRLPLVRSGSGPSGEGGSRNRGLATCCCQCLRVDRSRRRSGSSHPHCPVQSSRPGAAPSVR